MGTHTGESAVVASRKWHFHDPIFARYFDWLFPEWLLPNHITVLRFLLVPVVFWLLLIGDYRAGIPLFLFAGITDILDGSLARVRGRVTEWGIVYDPIADKLLVGSVLLVMAFDDVTGGLATLLLVIELVLLTGNVVMKRRGLIQAANGAGKIKMFLEVVGLGVLLSALATGSAKLVGVSMVVLMVAGTAALVSVVMGYWRMRELQLISVKVRGGKVGIEREMV